MKANANLNKVEGFIERVHFKEEGKSTEGDYYD